MASESSFAEMQSYTARLESFLVPHQLSKRRASSQTTKKKKGNVVEWPHKNPEPELLARAGFFYRPATNSDDNAQCFFCNVKLDGWEENDDPVLEHLAHSANCAYATAISVSSQHTTAQPDAESRNPMSEEMVLARHATFTFGSGWPHETKKGWKCKINKMVNAGWSWDPNPQADDGNDGVTCFYCNLSLDGWEPKDDPLEEHKRRAPDCKFFELMEQYLETKAKKAKTRGKASSRSSANSKTSRLSTQSALSEMLDATSDQIDFAGDEVADTTTASISVLQPSAIVHNSKKAAKPKAALKSAKANKSKKKVSTQHENSAMDVQNDQFREDESTQPSAELNEIDVAQPVSKTTTSTRGTKKGTRASKQVDPSTDGPNRKEVAEQGKQARAQKAPYEDEPQSEDVSMPETPNVEEIAKQRWSEVSAQLQDELEDSMGQVDDESTPHVKPINPKRGVKRTSDGIQKERTPKTSVVRVEIPIAAIVEPNHIASPKQASNSLVDTDVASLLKQEAQTIQINSHDHEDKLAKPAKNKKQTNSKAAGKIKGKSKGAKTSSARSSRSSKTTITSEQPGQIEDLARDERDIEEELARIASEQAADQNISNEQDLPDEYQPSPSQGRISKHNREIKILEDEIETESQQALLTMRDQHEPDPTPSPSGSDKENQPSTTRQSAKQAQSTFPPSPTKTTRIPLAPGTPNRSSNKPQGSPSKQISHLTSTIPWQAIDLDCVLLASPQPTPGRLGSQLTAAAGALNSPEKIMTVEAWIRYRAGQSEADLRRKCEEMVASFEKEGVRALQTLHGIQAI